MENLLKTPYYFLKNIQYNQQTFQIMKSVINVHSNCIDVGCHKGRFFDKMIALAPSGTHWGFEPLPNLYEQLKIRYPNPKHVVLPYALSDSEGQSIFKYVKNSPGYSGFRKRSYHIPFPEIIDIQVTKIKLDTVIDSKTKIDFIKIDVEGAELEVLAGAEKTIKRNKPFIIFEHGIGAASYYGTKPEDIFNFFLNCKMKIYTLKSWLHNKPDLNKTGFVKQFHKEINYYFLACS